MRYEEAIHPLHSMHPFEAMAEPARRRIIDILEGRIGWDPELGQNADPLATFERPVPRKGPGRAPRRGRRGHQSTPPTASEPDLGWRRGS